MREIERIGIVALASDELNHAGALVDRPYREVYPRTLTAHGAELK